MKIWNRPRGSGKTIRMLYASEYTGNNILVPDKHHADTLELTAKQMNLDIPKVITVNDFVNRRYECSKNIIIDESIYCLELLIKAIRPGTSVSDITLTIDDRED